MIRKQQLQPGDLLLYRPKSKWSIGSWFITFAQNVIGKSPIHNKSYSHVAMIDWDTNYVLESRLPKSQRAKIKWKKFNKQYYLELWRIKKVTPEERKRALTWASAHLNEWYDLGLFIFGKIDIKNAEVCSTFIAKAWKAAGRNFKVYKKLQPDADFHSPDELIFNRDLIKRIA